MAYPNRLFAVAVDNLIFCLGHPVFFDILAKWEFFALQMRIKDYFASVGVDSLFNHL